MLRYKSTVKLNISFSKDIQYRSKLSLFGNSRYHKKVISLYYLKHLTMDICYTEQYVAYFTMDIVFTLNNMLHILQWNFLHWTICCISYNGFFYIEQYVAYLRMEFLLHWTICWISYNRHFLHWTICCISYNFYYMQTHFSILFFEIPSPTYYKRNLSALKCSSANASTPES